jgi:hypothetical protein
VSHEIPDIADRERFITLLILGEVLTTRGEVGPLARIWRPAGRRRQISPENREKPPKDTPKAE